MKILPWALGMLVLATWIDKGIGLMVGGFSVNMFEGITAYSPTIPELMITLGIYSIGAMVLIVLWKVAYEVKKEAGTL